MTDENAIPPEDQALEDEMRAAMEAEAQGGDAPADPDGGGAPAPDPFVPTEEMPAGGLGDAASLALLYDLTMPVAIELGRTRMSVQEILALGRGSVIQLDRLAGEPIDVFVGDRKFAEGEVVVVGEQFGVRVTRLVSPTPFTPETAAEEAIA